MKYSKYLILSDYDGTLSREGLILPEREKEAINEFVSQGGTFAVATGRGFREIGGVFEDTPINAPSILWNGALVMDIKNKKLIKSYPLEGDVKGMLRDIEESFPDTIIQVQCMSEDFTVYFGDCEDELREGLKQFSDIGVNAEDHFIDFFKTLTNKLVTLEEINEPIYKFLIVGGIDRMKELKEYLLEKYDSLGYLIVSSAPFNVEVNSLQASKGQAGDFLKKEYFKDREYTVIALGDGENDIDALKRADYSFAANNASNEIKAAADYVLKENLGVIRQVLNFIDSSLR
ncbi:HAD-IIB family hydrolase [Alloiococcus sp. CFN-8]|uniref:HAD-IIB family hydrolase n=1 Tax=Alloiococcus sp. CFN-8 TaxID=3416081 RepID=UPI003CFA6CA7